VRPDFKGLPGQGSVEQGRPVREKCASCHGSFRRVERGVTPLVGGTTKDDIKTGRVKGLSSGELPRTTFTKVATISTVFDYIQRHALDGAQVAEAGRGLRHPPTCSTSEMVPADFVLSDKNIAEVQKLLPNRNGMTTDHGMWPGASARRAASATAASPT
jgi:cytochrome c